MKKKNLLEKKRSRVAETAGQREEREYKGGGGDGGECEGKTVWM